jgi:transposase-like protein
MIRFPLSDLLNEQESYNYLLHTLHPNGLHCKNGHPLPHSQSPHDCRCAPVVDYCCRECRNVYNVFTNTVWAGTHYN